MQTRGGEGPGETGPGEGKLYSARSLGAVPLFVLQS